MRAVLTQLLQDIVRAESHLEHGQPTQLLEANGRGGDAGAAWY